MSTYAIAIVDDNSKVVDTVSQAHRVRTLRVLWRRDGKYHVVGSALIVPLPSDCPWYSSKMAGIVTELGYGI